MRVPPLCAPVSLSIHTVFIMTGSSKLSMCSGMSPCSRWTGSPGRTTRLASDPRMQSAPRKWSTSGMMRGWSHTFQNAGWSVGRLAQCQASPSSGVPVGVPYSSRVSS